MKNFLAIIGGLSILGAIGFVASSFRPNYSIFKRAKWIWGESVC